MDKNKAKKKKPFLRQNYFRFKKLGEKWRRPRGKQSKMRIEIRGRTLKPKIGYKSPASMTGLVHGYTPVVVCNAGDLAKMKKNETAVISSGVGLRKALEIQKKAEELGVKIYNENKTKKAARHAFGIEKARAEKKKQEKKAVVKEAKPEKTEAKHQAKPDTKAKHEHVPKRMAPGEEKEKQIEE